MDLNPLSQLEIEAEIQRLVGELAIVTASVAQRGADFAHADHAYKVAYAKAYLRAKGMGQAKSIPEAEAMATIDCDELLWDRRRTEALLDAAKERGRNVRAALDAFRSINVNLRAAVATGE